MIELDTISLIHGQYYRQISVILSPEMSLALEEFRKLERMQNDYQNKYPSGYSLEERKQICAEGFNQMLRICTFEINADEQLTKLSTEEAIRKKEELSALVRAYLRIALRITNIEKIDALEALARKVRDAADTYRSHAGIEHFPKATLL